MNPGEFGTLNEFEEWIGELPEDNRFMGLRDAGWGNPVACYLRWIWGYDVRVYATKVLVDEIDGVKTYGLPLWAMLVMRSVGSLKSECVTKPMLLEVITELKERGTGAWWPLLNNTRK